jgi:NAD(P)-dependent dehydrogenase (short-subunit alcohol dehydrogenase family)
VERTRAPDGDHHCAGAMTMNRLLITGANRGLGLELVRLCAERGDRVFAGCRFPEGDTALKDLSTQSNGQVSIPPLEITDTGSLNQCVQRVRNEVDALDVLINNGP